MLLRGRRGRARQVAASLLLLGLLLAALLYTASARLQPADFTFNNGAEIQSLDPATVTGVPEGRIVRALFEGLCAKDPRSLEPIPAAAERWEISADGLRYTFHLREGARWSNGDPLTAHDFVASWQRLLHPRTAAEYAYQLWTIRGAREYALLGDELLYGARERAARELLGLRARDDLTLEVELEAPTPYFLDLAASPPLYPIHPRSLEEAQARWPGSWELEWMKPEHLVTNGPYRVLFRRINDRLRLIKNEAYWDADHVAFETIDALAVVRLGTALNLYLTGEVDWIDRPIPHAVPRLMPREDFSPAPYLGTYFYRVNVTRKPFDDPRVRRALALAIDRRAICEKVTRAGEIPAWSLVPPVLAGYPRNAIAGSAAAAARRAEDEDAAFAQDVAQARALIAEAGFGPHGAALPTIEIHFNTDETHEDIAEVVADGWKRHLGWNVKLSNQEWKVYLDTQNTLGYDLSRSSWIGDYPDANTLLDVWVTGGENNRTGWGDARYDARIRAAAREPNAERRLQLLAEAEQLLLEELPILPIYYYVTRNLVNPRLGGFHENFLDEHFPKDWYWMDDLELAAKRAALSPDKVRVEAPGPSAGLYSPARERERAARSE